MPNSESGLSEKNRNFILLLVAGILLVFGPIEPYGLAVRIAYLIIIPTSIWVILRFWSISWNIDSSFNDRLTRALASGIAGALLVGAYLSFTSSYHIECEQYAGNGENRECVGDYKSVEGPDIFAGFLQIIVSGGAIWFAISDKSRNEA
jgi:hypothetical protein